MTKRSTRSKGRSQRQLEVVFIVDECLGREALEVLAAQHETRLVKTEFGEGTDDPDFLPEIGRRGWLLITRDDAMRRRHAEFSAIARCKVWAFFVSAKLNGQQTASLLEAQLEKVVRYHARHLPPAMVRIHSGGVEHIVHKAIPSPQRRSAARRD